MFKFVVLICLFLSFCHGKKGSEPYNPDCSSRFGYEYQIMERLIKMEMDKSALLERLDALESGKTETRSVVAVSAKLSSSVILALKKTLVFDVALVNIGDANDITSGVFKAPISGIYLFSVTACVDNDDWLALYIMRNGDTILGEVRAGDDSFKDCSSDTTVTQLEKGDTVWVERRNESWGIGKIDIRHMSSLTGVLIG